MFGNKFKSRYCLLLLVFMAKTSAQLLIPESTPHSTKKSAPTLTFTISNQSQESFTLNEMKTKLKTHQIKYHDPHYDKVKRFAAFKLQDVLQLAFSKNWQDEIYTDIAFTALDGFKAISKVELLNAKGGYLVFADLDMAEWEPIGRKKAVPGPFYLVWTGKTQTAANGFPWPWQIARVTLLRFEDKYPNVYPKNAADDSSVFRGFKVFESRCFSCHSMSRQGGKVGPDLNAPQSIVAYRSIKMIKAFIKQPSRFRYTKMPDNLDLSDTDLDALVDYFRFQSQHR